MYFADRNQAEIIATLRAAGCSVAIITGANGQSGVPDLLAARQGVNYLLEVKTPKGKLSDVQRAWHAGWRGVVSVVRTPEEALAAVGITLSRG